MKLRPPALALVGAALAAVALPPAPLVAATPDKDRIALGAEIGVFAPFESDYATGYSFGGTFDYYRTSRLGLRATASYAHAGTSLPGDPGHSIGNLLVSGTYRWPMQEVHPFVQAGAGLYIVEPAIGGRTVRIGAHVGGGAEYFLNRRTAVTGTGLLHFLTSAGDRTASYASLSFGLRYYF